MNQVEGSWLQAEGTIDSMLQAICHLKWQDDVVSTRLKPHIAEDTVELIEGTLSIGKSPRRMGFSENLTVEPTKIACDLR